MGSKEEEEMNYTFKVSPGNVKPDNYYSMTCEICSIWFVAGRSPSLYVYNYTPYANPPSNYPSKSEWLCSAECVELWVMKYAK